MKRQVTIPLVCSIILHTVLFLLLVLNLSLASDPKVIPPQPQVIQATLVKLEEQAPTQASQTQAERKASPKPEREPQPPAPRETKPPQPEPKPAPPPKVDEQQRQQEQKKLEEQKKQAELKKLEAQKKLEADKAKAAEAKRAEAERQRKAEEERKSKAEADRKRQEAERQRKAEEERRRADAERQRREELARAMAAEEQAMAAAKQGQAAASFKTVIAQLIQQSWSRPPSARTGMSTLLRIQMLRTGQVVDVKIVKSSGNAEFDQSAVNAVRRVGSFPVPQEMSDAMFRREFSSLQLDFTPQDLRL